MNPNGRRLDEPFVTTEGLHMYPPSRPHCRCGVALGFGGRGPQSAAAASRREMARRTAGATVVAAPARRLSVRRTRGGGATGGAAPHAAGIPANWKQSPRTEFGDRLHGHTYTNPAHVAPRGSQSWYTDVRTEDLPNILRDGLDANMTDAGEVWANSATTFKQGLRSGFGGPEFSTIEFTLPRAAMKKMEQLGYTVADYAVAAKHLKRVYVYEAPVTRAATRRAVRRSVTPPPPRYTSIDDFRTLDAAALERQRTLGGGLRPGETYLHNPIPRADFLPVTADLREVVRETLTEAQYLEMLVQANAAQVTRVPLASLSTGQEFVVRSTVQGYVNTPGMSPPLLVRMNGRNVIYNGNHRVAAELLRGSSEIDAILIDLDAIRGLPRRAVRRAPVTPGGIQVARGTTVTAREAEAVSEVLTRAGVDPRVVTFDAQLGRASVGQGAATFEGQVAGVYMDGQIRLAPGLSPRTLRSVAAHEAQHLKFDVAIMRTGPSVEAGAFRRQLFNERAAYAAEDGVTPYSRAHWKEYERLVASADAATVNGRLAIRRAYDVALDETLAEIQTLRELGRTVGTPRYQALLKHVEKAFAKASKAGPGVRAGRRVPRHRVLREAAEARKQRELLKAFLQQEQRVAARATYPKGSTAVHRPSVTPASRTTPPTLQRHAETGLRDGRAADALPVEIRSVLTARERALLNDVQVRYTHGSKVALDGRMVNGKYVRDERVIALATNGALSTAAHEVGHAIDHALGVAGASFRSTSRPFFKAVQKGLDRKGAYTDLLTKVYAQEKLPREVFADLYVAMRFNLPTRTGRFTAAQMQRQFPEAWKWLQDLLKDTGVLV